MTKENLTSDVVNYTNKTFLFKAKVVRVVDGDTIYCDVDLGFHVRILEKFRFDYIDTPEIYRPQNEHELQHGREAKKFLENLILNKTIWLKTKKTGKYGRWIASVYLDDGTNIQRLLIENGFKKKEIYLSEEKKQ